MDINCNVVKDLASAYIAGSCSDYTKTVIDEHIANCNSCKQLLVNFKNSDTISDNYETQKVITRVTKQRNIFIALSSVSLAIIIVAAAISCKLFILGSIAPTSAIDTVKFEMKDERTFAYEFRAVPFNQLKSKTQMTAPDELGNIYIRISTVLISPLKNPYEQSSGTNRYDREINGVYLQGKDKNDIRILWEKE